MVKLTLVDAEHSNFQDTSKKPPLGSWERHCWRLKHKWAWYDYDGETRMIWAKNSEAITGVSLSFVLSFILGVPLFLLLLLLGVHAWPALWFSFLGVSPVGIVLLCTAWRDYEIYRGRSEEHYASRWQKFVCKLFNKFDADRRTGLNNG